MPKVSKISKVHLLSQAYRLSKKDMGHITKSQDIKEMQSQSKAQKLEIKMQQCFMQEIFFIISLVKPLQSKYRIKSYNNSKLYQERRKRDKAQAGLGMVQQFRRQFSKIAKERYTNPRQFSSRAEGSITVQRRQKKTKIH